MRLMIVGILIFLHIIMALTLRIAGNPHKNVVLENTLPDDKLDDPAVTELRKEYKKRLLQLALGLSILSLTIFIPKYESIAMTIFWIVMLGSLVGFYACEIVYIRKMRQLMNAKNWRMPIKPILLDTQLIQTKNQKMVSWIWFLPSLLLIVLGALISRHYQTDGLWILILASLLVWLSLLFSWYAISRLAVRSITDQPAINKQFNDITKHHWSLMMVVFSWVFAPLIFLPLISFSLTGILGKSLIILFILLLLAGLGFTVYYMFDLRKKQDQLVSQADGLRYYGDDQYWRYGIYMNPNDNRLMVPDRLGMNLSMNLGRTSGKIIIGLTGLLLVAAFIFSLVPLYFFDFTSDPFVLELKKDTVVLDAPITAESVIPYQDIKAVSLENKLQEPVMRTNGLGTENYGTGYFTVAGEPATFYVDYRSKPILKIETQKRDYYYTNKRPENTRKLYQELEKKLK